MQVVVRNSSVIIGERSFRCALGFGGCSPNKREGDGKTPVGRFPLREVLYRADRLAKPFCGLPVRALGESDGWCDAPLDSNYNKLVELPYPARHEVLWRQDDLYDLIVVVGYNDDPVKAGAGSAIFVHLARGEYEPTQGCVALALPDLLFMVSNLTIDSTLTIEADNL